MKILVLFGNKNFYDGSLSAVAKSRCDEAIEFLLGEKDFFVLPTGAYGARFNTTHIAHGQYLTDYLEKRGITKDRILVSYTNSSNTVEDVLCVRKLAIDNNASEVKMLTSDFHMKRVKYISERLFHDVSMKIKICYQKIQTPWEKIDPLDRWEIKTYECRSLEKLQREWVDVPL